MECSFAHGVSLVRSGRRGKAYILAGLDGVTCSVLDESERAAYLLGDVTRSIRSFLLSGAAYTTERRENPQALP